ncbi:hypothetical protein [Sphingobacterium pedocola]|uniref:Tryptophan-rich sensory protein n=1 Tax=Sphingobacterium pedocola TaxID=2082722 RepID=A0ABR9TD63_9SPHI|nr:hypothetical protein [Sphingobacterium pedocola]MBE8723004.1 hypothetical protein [Sphingobacterium pedocola]
MKKKSIVILNTVSLIITLVINYLSNTGFFNGNTMKTVSDRYDNLFTPASYAFSIWGLIYLFLISHIIYSISIRKSEHENSIIKVIGIWFSLSSILNSVWVVCWLNDYIGLSVCIMIALLLVLLKIITNIHANYNRPSLKTKVFVFLPFSLYAGWISVALIANIAAFLTKIKWDGWGASEMTWTVAMILIAGLVNVLMIWKKNLISFGLVGIWALIAVAISNDQVSPICLVAGATALLILLSCIIRGIAIFRYRKVNTP